MSFLIDHSQQFNQPKQPGLDCFARIPPVKSLLTSQKKSISTETGNTIHAWLPILLSIALAALLSVYPLGSVLANMRPMFIFVVTLFWVLHRPWLVGIWFALLTGLLSDLLLDTQLGQQALSSVIAVFILQLISSSAKQIADVQAMFIASVCIAAYSVVLLLLQLLGGQVISWRYGLPMFTSILIWPIIVLLLKRR